LLIVHPFPADAYTGAYRRDQALDQDELRKAVRDGLAGFEDAGMEFNSHTFGLQKPRLPADEPSPEEAN